MENDEITLDHFVGYCFGTGSFLKMHLIVGVERNSKVLQYY